MRTLILGTALLVVTCATAAAQVVQTDPHRTSTDVWGQYFDPNHQITFKGRVTGIVAKKPSGSTDSEETLVVRDRNGGSAVVDLGPTWYVNHQTAKVHMNEWVQVTGTKAMIEDQSVILSSQILLKHKGGPVLALRRLDGRPYWQGTMVAQNPQMPTASSLSPGTKMIQGTFTGTQSYSVHGVPYEAGVVQTEGGTQLIDLGPQWYWGNQNMTYSAGDYVTVVYGPVPYMATPYISVLPTYSVYRGNDVYSLRDINGNPAYSWGNGN